MWSDPLSENQLDGIKQQACGLLQSFLLLTDLFLFKIRNALNTLMTSIFRIIKSSNISYYTRL